MEYHIHSILSHFRTLYFRSGCCMPPPWDLIPSLYSLPKAFSILLPLSDLSSSFPGSDVRACLDAIKSTLPLCTMGRGREHGRLPKRLLSQVQIVPVPFPRIALQNSCAQLRSTHVARQTSLLSSNEILSAKCCQTLVPYWHSPILDLPTLLSSPLLIPFSHPPSPRIAQTLEVPPHVRASKQTLCQDACRQDWSEVVLPELHPRTPRRRMQTLREGHARAQSARPTSSRRQGPRVLPCGGRHRRRREWQEDRRTPVPAARPRRLGRLSLHLGAGRPP